jgi:hypothetical protein
MSKNLEIIKELELEIGFKLRKEEIETVWNTDGYQVNANNNVVALSLYQKGLKKIPQKIFEVKNLAVLYLVPERK